MPKRMLIHDRRLEGNPPSIAQNTYQVDLTTSTQHIIDWVQTYSQGQNGLDQLFVMCHGFTDGTGFDGLQLGAQNLTIRNVIMTSAWKPRQPLIRSIYLYACGPATGSMLGNPATDGQRFCGELALWTGADVYAADAIQWYSRVRSGWQRLFGTNERGTIDFGAWEGQVYRFSPDDGSATRTNLMPQPT
jgi:hypothetical protein